MNEDWAMDIIGCVLYTLLAIVVVIIVGGICYGCFWLLDNLFTSPRKTTGKVDRVSFYPEHTETYYNVALKMPMTRTVPDQWSVLVVTPEGSDWMDVDNAPNRWFAKGKNVLVDYKRGRITNNFRLIKIHGVGQ